MLNQGISYPMNMNNREKYSGSEMFKNSFKNTFFFLIYTFIGVNHATQIRFFLYTAMNLRYLTGYLKKLMIKHYKY